jgi:phosphate/sulfate permease
MLILKISGGWLLSPIIGGIVAGLCWWPLKRFTFKSEDPTKRIFQFLPSLAGITTGILALFILYKGLSPLHVKVSIRIALPCAIALGAVFGLVIWKVVTPRLKKRIDNEILEQSHKEEEHKETELEENVAQEHTDENVQVESNVSEHTQEKNPDEMSEIVMNSDQVETTTTQDENADFRDHNPDEVSEAPMIKQEHDEEDLSVAISTGKVEDQILITEKHAFNFLVIITSCCIATAHGANDISNAAGPLGAIVWTYTNQALPNDTTSTEVWVTIITAIGLVIGLATLGYRVMLTIGDKITKLTPSRAFVAQLGTAFITLTASVLGLPLSTTHIIVGAVYGISIVDMTSFRDLQWKMLLGIVLSWVITIPASSIMSLLVFMLFKLML